MPKSRFVKDAIPIDFSSDHHRPDHVVLAKRAAWQGVYAEHAMLTPTESNNCPQQLIVGIHLGQALKLDWQFEGERKQYRRLITPGSCHIFPPNMAAWGRWFEPTELFVLALEPAVLSSVTQAAIKADRVEILQRIGMIDPALQRLGHFLQAELASGGLGGSLYAEALAHAIAIHLLRHHSTVGKPIQEPTGRLPERKLQQVIAYIDAYLHRSIALEELATVVQVSPYYFSRLFKEATGIPPYQYLQQQRVERAKLLLKQEDTSIAEIARQCGLSNPSHFTTVFRKYTGITPNLYRQQ